MRRKLSNWRRGQKHQPATAPHPNGDEEFLEQHPQSEAEKTEWDKQWEERLFTYACEQVRGEVSPTTWQAFWRTAVDDVPGKEVAAELDMSVAAVYQARSRVLARLRQEADGLLD